MTEMIGEFQPPTGADEHDVPVAAFETEIPAHVELQLVEEAVESIDEAFMADAQARLEGEPVQAAAHPDNLPIYTPPERTEAEKEVARDTIRNLGEALGRERRRQLANSLTAKRLRY